MELPLDRAPSRRGSRAAGLRSGGRGAGGRRRSGAAEAPMSPLLPGSQRDATTEGDDLEGAVCVYAPDPLSKTTTWTYWTTFLYRASWYCSPNLDSEMICSYQLLFACIHQHTSLLLWHASFRLGNTRLVGHRQIHVSSVRYGALKLIMATVSRES